MSAKDKYGVYAVGVLFLAFVLVVGVFNGCKKEAPPPAGPNEAAEPAQTAPVDAAVDPLEAATSLFREPKASLQNVIKAAKTWQPAFEQYR